MSAAAATDKDYDLVEGPPEDPGDPWWVGLARGLGSATRSLVDGAGRLTGIFRATPGSKRRPRSSDETLEELLVALSQRLGSQHGQDPAALASDEEFWALLRRIQRARRSVGLAQGRQPKALEPAGTPAAEPDQPPRRKRARAAALAVEPSTPSAAEPEASPEQARPAETQPTPEAETVAASAALDEEAGGEDFLADVLSGEGESESEESELDASPAAEIDEEETSDEPASTGRPRKRSRDEQG